MTFSFAEEFFVTPRHISTAVGNSEIANSVSSTAGGHSPAVQPPTIAPSAVAISNVMPNRMLAVPRSTFTLATAL